MTKVQLSFKRKWRLVRPIHRKPLRKKFTPWNTNGFQRQLRNYSSNNPRTQLILRNKPLWQRKNKNITLSGWEILRAFSTVGRSAKKLSQALMAPNTKALILAQKREKPTIRNMQTTLERRRKNRLPKQISPSMAK